MNANKAREDSLKGIFDQIKIAADNGEHYVIFNHLTTNEKEELQKKGFNTKFIDAVNRSNLRGPSLFLSSCWLVKW